MFVTSVLHVIGYQNLINNNYLCFPLMNSKFPIKLLSSISLQKPQRNLKMKQRKFFRQVWNLCTAKVKLILNKEALLDILALLIFPLCFLVFNYVYWSHYLNQKYQRWENVLKEFREQE